MHFATHNPNLARLDCAYDFQLIDFMERSGQIQSEEANFMRAFMRHKIAM